ncbi:hypothetical protein ACWCW7_17770 [Nocardia tengchongensis]
MLVVAFVMLVPLALLLVAIALRRKSRESSHIAMRSAQSVAVALVGVAIIIAILCLVGWLILTLINHAPPPIDPPG